MPNVQRSRKWRIGYASRRLPHTGEGPGPSIVGLVSKDRPAHHDRASGRNIPGPRQQNQSLWRPRSHWWTVSGAFTWCCNWGAHQNCCNRSARTVKVRRTAAPFSLRSLTSSPFLPPTLSWLSLDWSPSKVSQIMDTHRKSRQHNQPPLHLVTSPTPAQPISTRVQNHKQSESPFRYLTERLANEEAFDEKDQTPLADISTGSSGRRANSNSRTTHRSSPSTSRSSTPAPSNTRPHSKQSNQRIRSTTPILPPTAADNGRGRPLRSLRRTERSPRSSLSTRLKPWLPIILYGISSLGFVVAIAFWRTEIFQGMAPSRIHSSPCWVSPHS